MSGDEYTNGNAMFEVTETDVCVAVFITVCVTCDAFTGMRGWVHHVPGPLRFRKSGSTKNRTRDHYICSQEP